MAPSSPVNAWLPIACSVSRSEHYSRSASGASLESLRNQLDKLKVEEALSRTISVTSGGLKRGFAGDRPAPRKFACHCAMEVE